jgi:hypothetical protein
MSAEIQPGSMRAELPNAAAIVDEFRCVFGVDEVNQGIRLAMADKLFYAEDFVTGKSIGTKPDDSAVVASGVSGDGTHWIHLAGAKK